MQNAKTEESKTNALSENARKVVKAASEMERRTRVKLIVALIVVVLIILIAGGILGGRHLWYAKQNREGLAPMNRDDLTRPGAKEYISASLAETEKNDEIVDYLELDPYLVNIYEGFGFSKDYGSARGHAYTLTDVANTERPHPLANCLTCKSGDFTRLVNRDGVEVYTRGFNDVYSLMETGISCYNCHGEDPEREGSNIRITHSYVTKALGEQLAGINPSTLACGQCHIEYYFTPDDKETMMPYSDVSGMAPEAILAYYDSFGFYDWVQPTTGAKMLKAQHPELETYLQGAHANTLTCADCHMPIEQSYDGVVYHSHYLVSPLENQTLLSTCVQCHGDTDMENMVKGIQRRVTARETQVGNKLSSFKNALAVEVARGEESALSAEEIDQVRKLYREAQWFFDYCYVENSEGAHNSDLSMHCLEVAEQKINEGSALLNKVGED